MNDDSKKPGVAFWATVVAVVVLLVYPLSFGPACWAVSRVSLTSLWTAADFFYSPILRVWMNDDGKVSDVIDWYANVGAGSDSGEITVGEVDGFVALATVRAVTPTPAAPVTPTTTASLPSLPVEGTNGDEDVVGQ